MEECEDRPQANAASFDARRVAALGAHALAELVVEHAEHDDELAAILTLRLAAVEETLALRGVISDAIEDIAADCRSARKLTLFWTAPLPLDQVRPRFCQGRGRCGSRTRWG
jgi:hypothetical protein